MLKLSQKRQVGRFFRTRRTRPGVSLLISLILVGVLVLFGLGVSNLVVSSIRQSANVNRANEAYFAAEGALEQGLLENVEAGAGYTKSASDVPYCLSGETCPKATVKIQGQVPVDAKIGDEFIVPAPGTGNVAKNCNPLTAVKTGNFNYEYLDGSTIKTGTADAIDHPCNWNKIKVGDSVALPLYTSTDSTYNNPSDMGLNKLKIKIRTACIDGNEMCPPEKRYVLDTTNGDPIYKCNPPTKTYFCGDGIVLWQISGPNKNGDKVYTMVPADDFDLDLGIRPKKNTEIYESLIEGARLGILSSVFISGFSCDKYCVVYGDISTGQRGGKELATGDLHSITDFLLNIDPPRTGNEVINKPVLKLTVVHSLNDTLGDTIPYLEYQVATNVSVGGQLPADTAQTITAEGYSGTFKQVLEVKQPQESGLLEYVIQQ